MPRRPSPSDRRSARRARPTARPCRGSSARATAACRRARRAASCVPYATSWVSGCLKAYSAHRDRRRARRPARRRRARAAPRRARSRPSPVTARSTGSSNSLPITAAVCSTSLSRAARRSMRAASTALHRGRDGGVVDRADEAIGALRAGQRAALHERLHELLDEERIAGGARAQARGEIAERRIAAEQLGEQLGDRRRRRAAAARAACSRRRAASRRRTPGGS